MNQLLVIEYLDFSTKQHEMLLIKNLKDNVMDYVKLENGMVIKADLATILEVINTRELNFESVRDNIELWSATSGTLTAPFTGSFNEYTSFKDLDCSLYEFRVWLKSIAYSMGWRVYEEIDDEIIIPGFGKVVVDKHIGTDITGRWVREITLSDDLDKKLFTCGVDFWYDFLGLIAAEANLNMDSLRYQAAEQNIMDKLFYYHEAFLPYDTAIVLRLCKAEGISMEQAQDREFMNEKYYNWLEQGLIK